MQVLILNIHACYVILMAHQELSILLTPCTWTYLLDTINKAIYPRLIAVWMQWWQLAPSPPLTNKVESEWKI